MWTSRAQVVLGVAFLGVVVTNSVDKAGGSQEQASSNETAHPALNMTYSNMTQPVAEPFLAAAFCVLHPRACLNGVRIIADIMFPEAPVQKTSAARTAWPTTSGFSLWIVGVAVLAVNCNMAKI